MTLICFASQKGSPGTTATSLAVAAALKVSPGRRKVLLEADSTGGTLAIRYRLPVEPGLLTLAAAIRSGMEPEGLWRHTQELPGGLSVIVCPDGPEQVNAAMAASGAQLGRYLSTLRDVDVICDVGRLAPDSPALDFVAEASAVLMVARPSAEQLQPAARRMMMLRSQVSNIGWVLIGQKPYGPLDVESTYDFPVVGVIADDARSVTSLENGVVTKRIRRHPFIRSSATLAQTLSDWLAPLTQTPEPTPGPDDGPAAEAPAASALDEFIPSDEPAPIERPAPVEAPALLDAPAPTGTPLADPTMPGPMPLDPEVEVPTIHTQPPPPPPESIMPTAAPAVPEPPGPSPEALLPRPRPTAGTSVPSPPDMAPPDASPLPPPASAAAPATPPAAFRAESRNGRTNGAGPAGNGETPPNQPVMSEPPPKPDGPADPADWLPPSSAESNLPAEPTEPTSPNTDEQRDAGDGIPADEFEDWDGDHFVVTSDLSEVFKHPIAGSATVPEATAQSQTVEPAAETGTPPMPPSAPPMPTAAQSNPASPPIPPSPPMPPASPPMPPVAAQLPDSDETTNSAEPSPFPHEENDADWMAR